MRSRAFTLIELLVVISVVAGLMAVFVPALAKARQQGKSVSCLSNLRQLAIASQVYVSNNDGFYPIAYTNQFTSSTSVFYAWDFTTIQKLSPFERKVIPGLLWEGRTIEEVQQCPSFKGSAAWIADSYTGYNYNTSYIGHGQFESIVTPAMAVMVKRPGRCALFGDGQWSGGANKFMRSPWPSDSDEGFSGRYAGTQGYRHNSRTNVVYCDGHTETVKDCFKKTDIAEVDNIAPGTGFLSPDNSAYDLD